MGSTSDAEKVQDPSFLTMSAWIHAWMASWPSTFSWLSSRSYVPSGMERQARRANAVSTSPPVGTPLGRREASIFPSMGREKHKSMTDDLRAAVARGWASSRMDQASYAYLYGIKPRTLRQWVLR
jgi:hypothetical protein